jgi:phage gp36-like protein
MSGPGRAELALALHASGPETSSGVGDAIDLADPTGYDNGVGARSLAYVDLDVLAASGMGPVSSSGTLPPTITLSGAPSGTISFVVQCLTAGALGTWSGQWSADGGATWTAFTSAASVVLGSTGVTVAIAAGNASTDNVWTSSTPTLSITIETSRDGNFWHKATIGAFDPVAVAGYQRKAFIDLDRYVRARWTVAGVGASFTFALSGAAMLVYAGIRNVSSLALRAQALVDLTVEEQADGLVAASDQADQKLGARYKLPLVSWSLGISKHAASIASLTFMQARGYAPEPGQRDTFRDAYNQAIDFFDDVFTRGDPSITDQNPADDFNTGLPDPPPRDWHRGWYTR